MKPTPILGTAYHLIAKDEQQRVISSIKKPSVDSAAFQTFSPNRSDNNLNHPHNKTTQRDTKRNNDEAKH